MENVIYAFITGALAWLVFSLLLPILPGLGGKKDDKKLK